MDTSTNLHRVLEAAVSQLLRPLFRLLLRQSMSFVAFEEIAKRVYVEVAMRDFAIEGKQPSMSRAAILSGLTRKEVSRLLTAPAETDAGLGERYNRAARVLTGWVRDPDFLDAAGQPLPLPAEGGSGFAALVKRHGADAPVRAVLDELLRVGAVRRLADGRIDLVVHAYVPSQSLPDKLGILGSDVADLIDTIDHNLQPGGQEPRFQRKVMYHRIPAAALPAFRRLSATQAQALLERLDRWLAEHDTGPAADDTTQRAARVGLGIHYFEEPLSPSAPSGDTP